MERLNQIALDAEFLLISVIQGVALTTLAAAAVHPLNTLDFLTWPYIVTAFLMILIFWSGAIIHAVSFIDWPIDLLHSFLYFFASLVEILAITNLDKPLLWYIFIFVFEVVAFGLYIYDLQLIKKHERKFSRSIAGKQLFVHILKEQKKELTIFLPASIVFNIVAIGALVSNPSLFLLKSYHVVFIGFQCLFAFIFLWQEVKTFKKRSQLLLTSVK